MSYRNHKEWQARAARKWVFMIGQYRVFSLVGTWGVASLAGVHIETIIVFLRCVCVPHVRVCVRTL